MTAVAAGITLAIEQGAADHLDTGSRSALGGGAILYLISVTTAQRATVLGFPPRTVQARAVAVVALLALALAGGDLNPLVFTALTTAVLVALVVFKLWSAHRAAGRTALETASSPNA